MKNNKISVYNCVCARACVQRAEQIGFQDSQAGLHLLDAVGIFLSSGAYGQ